MVEIVVGSSTGRASDETLVGREAGPLPEKQGEIGWVAPAEDTTRSLDELPARHPADRSPTPTPTPISSHPNTSTTSLQSRSSALKQFLRTPRPLPKIHGVRPSTILRVALIALTLVGSIVGWIITVTKMSRMNEQESALPPPPTQEGETAMPAPGTAFEEMTNSSLVFVHVAFGAAVLFQLLMLERGVYRLRAERYAHLHPDEMVAALAGNGSSVMGLAPWNRPPLPTYAAALGVRGTGDVEDNIIAVPPPPEYGNTRGSRLLLAGHLPPNLTRPSSSRSGRDSQGTIRDALGRPAEAWSRPVSYGEDQLLQNARRSLDLETALARLEGPGVARPEAAVVRS